MFRKIWNRYFNLETPSFDALQKESERKIICLLSRGNVLLQRGCFTTKEEISELRKKVLNFNFDK